MVHRDNLKSGTHTSYDGAHMLFFDRNDPSTRFRVIALWKFCKFGFLLISQKLLYIETIWKAEHICLTMAQLCYKRSGIVGQPVSELLPLKCYFRQMAETARCMLKSINFGCMYLVCQENDSVCFDIHQEIGIELKH